MPTAVHALGPPNNDDSSETSLHVRRAREGDPDSLNWIVTRFDPGLLAVVRHHNSALVRSHAEDLVAESWLVALPRLAGLSQRGSRYTPVVFRFLSSVLKNVISAFLTKAKRRDQLAHEEPASGNHRLVDERSGAVTRAARGELEEAISEVIASMPSTDREVLILRAIEQQTFAEVALRLNITPDAAARRFSRALKRLKSEAPGSIFEDLI